MRFLDAPQILAFHIVSPGTGCSPIAQILSLHTDRQPSYAERAPFRRRLGAPWSARREMPGTWQSNAGDITRYLNLCTSKISFCTVLDIRIVLVCTCLAAFAWNTLQEDKQAIVMIPKCTQIQLPGKSPWRSSRRSWHWGRLHLLTLHATF